jgi:hypothetical protein
MSERSNRKSRPVARDKAEQVAARRMHAEGTGEGRTEKDLIPSSPQGDVTYDHEALREAARRMHTRGTGG